MGGHTLHFTDPELRPLADREVHDKYVWVR